MDYFIFEILVTAALVLVIFWIRVAQRKIERIENTLKKGT